MKEYAGVVLPGKPYPLGSTFDGHGVNFALFSENATGVKLCLFNNAHDLEEAEHLELSESLPFSSHFFDAYLQSKLNQDSA